MEQQIPNRSVEAHRAISYSRFLAAKKKTMLRLTVKAIARRHGGVFLVDD
jgi:hypothetical protein